MNNELQTTNRNSAQINYYSPVLSTPSLAENIVAAASGTQGQSQVPNLSQLPQQLPQPFKKNSTSTISTTTSNEMDRENRHSRDLMDRRIPTRDPEFLQSTTTSNSTTPSNRDPNGYRSASESRGKRFSRVNSDLLQTALNQNFILTKSNSTHSLLNQHDSKNIPMNPQDLQLQMQLQIQQQQQQQQQLSNRPHIKRWNSYNIARTKFDLTNTNDNDNEKLNLDLPPQVQVQPQPQHQHLPHQQSNLHPLPSEQQEKSSISPLTVLKDEYNTKRPVITTSSSTLFNTDNSFQNLVDKSDNVLDSQINPQNASPSKSNKLYQKINHIISIAHDSMHSLVPMLSIKDGVVEEVEGENTVATTVNSRMANYQSESDDGSDDDDTTINNIHHNHNGNDLVDESLQNNDTQYRLDSWKSPIMEENLIMDPHDVNEIIEEINDFQNNFVYKYNTSNPNPDTNPETNERINRTQQKLLDYKELYSTDEFINRASNSSTSSSASLAALNIENSYDLKIQNETILTQYNSIRLRFPTKIVSSGKSKSSTATTTATTGVLGYLNRYKPMISNPKNSKQLDKDNKISFDDKDDILRNIWENESRSFFQSESSNSVKLM
ncbi:hypothetical protein DFJ63DRAFT_313931 [Scheffersomyces coipomensis]|uniref:uncharacterized protein n=1 Tax=Scheffersomyces coipomensis TaxID=1788519 RepID=UPI00315DCD7C